MAAVIYLDIDDEITSAAARIRSAEERRVVLVVPGGSRLATSRINFRLLAREAQTRGRRLWIVAGDGATRALAASAGLAVYGSVAEYEDAMEVPAPTEQDEAVATPPAPPRKRRRATVPKEPSADAALWPESEPAGPEAIAGAALGAVAPEAEIDAAAAAAAPSGGTPPDLALPAAEPPRPRPSQARSWTSAPARSVPSRPPQARPRAEVSSGATPSIPVVGPRREWPIGRTTAVIAGIALALVIAVGGVAAYVFLPSATIVVTAHPVPVGPVDLTVRADPGATAVDPGTDTVPAQQLTFKVVVSDTFKTKGSRVVRTAAKGTVRFTSENTLFDVTVPAGTKVSTESGIDFVTTQAVVVPRASFDTGPTTRDAAIQAVEKGTSGNVAAGTITREPDTLRSALIAVNNPAPTSGGSRKEFPKVGQDEIDAALASLRKQLGTRFNELIANPTGIPEGTTLYPETKHLGSGTPSIDPTGLVDKEVETFDLGMTANGTVTAVAEAAVQQFAALEITGDVAEGHQLVDDSVSVSIGEPTVEGAVVSFPATATAQQVRQLDAKALLAQIKGKTVPQARSILEQFGEVQLSVWPGWVTAIPTIDARVSFTAETSSTPLEPGESTGPGASASP